MYVWFELYESKTNSGSRTLKICKNVPEAKKLKKDLIRRGLYQRDELHIDKWKDIDNPQLIESVE